MTHEAVDQVLEVRGDFACFSRPDVGKVERLSYPIITPSAARGIYDAIYWKPKFRWQVTQVELLSIPRYIALRRNEMKQAGPSDRQLDSWMQGRSAPEPARADGGRDELGGDQEGRTQRQTIALKDVRYRLHAFIAPWPEHDGEVRGMEEQFRRRASRGQCVWQPCLGCREFAAFFSLVDSKPAVRAENVDLDVGWMLYDVFDQSSPGSKTSRSAISMFYARVTAGTMIVPRYDADAVHKPFGDIGS